MRILVLGSKEYPFGSNKGEDPMPSGGIETYVENYAKELAKDPRIERITIITRKFAGTAEHERKGKIEVVRVQWKQGRLFRNPTFNLNAYLAARKLQFDIVHAHGPVAALLGLRLAKEKGIPLVVTPHGLAAGQPQYGTQLNRILKRLETFAYRRADAVVFLSKNEKIGFSNKLGFIPRHATIIPTGVDIERYGTPAVCKRGRSIRKSLKLSRIPTLIFVGRLVKVKGTEYLLDAMTRLKDKHATLLIIGDGPERKALEAQADRLQLGKRVRFLGHRLDIPELMAAADLFVLPSVSEGLPVSMLEAMASGLPCVVTDIGLPVKNNATAMVVPPKDSTALARSVDQLLASKSTRNRLITGGQELARKFSWEKTCRQYFELFAYLVRARARR